MSGVEECYRGKFVRVFRLDRAGILERLRDASNKLVRERPEVLRVLLFGSLARGDAGPGSDADVLVVVSATRGPFLDRSNDLAPYFDDVGVGCDLFVYSEEEMQSEIAPPLVRTALTEGVLLKERPEPSNRPD